MQVGCHYKPVLSRHNSRALQTTQPVTKTSEGCEPRTLPPPLPRALPHSSQQTADGAAGSVHVVTGLVGRKQEQEVLARALDDALEGRPRVVLIGGEPGIGKTRLAAECTELARARHAQVRWARSPDGVTPAPFGLWMQALGTDPSPLQTPTAASPESARFQLFDAVTRRLRADAAAGGMTLVFDDAQRADEGSLLLLLHFVRALHDDQMLVLITHRTVPAEETAAWQAVAPELARELPSGRLTLRGLSADETSACVTALTGRPVTAGDAAAIHRATGGNPFFVTELARSGAMPVPGTVLEVVARRVDTLPPPSRHLLVTAAVLGEQFSLPITAALVRRPAMECLQLLEAAAHASLVEPTVPAGEWRFSHALVRDAVEARVPLPDRVALHRAAALAIEQTYGGETHAAALARHWAVVASTGERRQAVDWARRAAEAAMRGLAFEEGARLYRLALDAGGADLDEAERSLLLLDLAQAEWRSGHLEACHAACAETVDRARRTQRPDRVGAAALVLEPIGLLTWDLDIAAWCKEALASQGLDPESRPRLLARLAEALVYTADRAGALTASAEALELASATADPTTVVAVLHARQLALSSPDQTDERIAIADRVTQMGVGLRRPSVEMWGRLWRIDAHWERGELAAIGQVLPRLLWCTDNAGGPVPRWHFLVAKAALAQAEARFAEAVDVGRQAFELMHSMRHPGAFGAYASMLCSVGHHIGHAGLWDALMPADAPLAPSLPTAEGDVRGAIFAPLGRAQILAETGQLEAALAAYRRAGSVASWRPSPIFRVPVWSLGSLLAVALDQGDDVAYFAEMLESERGHHAVACAGNSSYLGPVELHLGRTAAYLGDIDQAVADLRTAAAACRASGADGFAVEAEVELATVLARDPAGTAARRSEAAAIAGVAMNDAARLGMAPWSERAAAVGRAATVPDLLSPRENEVALLVARGSTNRAIADALYVSERTAQTHVQHILSKLGFSNRSQIAAWVASRSRAPNT